MYINILFIIIMIVAILIIAKQKELTKVVKGFVITMLLLTVGLAALFEYSTTQSDKNSRPILTAYKEGKSLTCTEKDIDINTYSYEPGTSSFQPRHNVVGETYAVKECSVK